MFEVDTVFLESKEMISTTLVSIYISVHVSCLHVAYLFCRYLELRRHQSVCQHEVND